MFGFSVRASLFVVLCGCSASDDAGGGGGSTAGSGEEDSSGATTDATAESSSSGIDEITELCLRWNVHRADLSEGTWSGNVAACDPGDISAVGRENALRVANLYRWIADLPPIVTSDDRNAKAQACALMMTANNALSHTPPPDWACFSAEGSEAAGSSNIAGGAGVFAIDMYMVDDGNATTLGHRRWLLSNSIGPTGIGSTGTFSCMWTLGGTGTVGAEWVAWPPPGAFPIAASQLPWSSMDLTGWSIQSDTIDFTNAQVEITADGEMLPVTITVLAGGYGSTYAISMIPIGWMMTAGTSYHVRITGVGQTIEYDVDVVIC